MQKFVTWQCRCSSAPAPNPLFQTPPTHPRPHPSPHPRKPLQQAVYPLALLRRRQGGHLAAEAAAVEGVAGGEHVQPRHAAACRRVGRGGLSGRVGMHGQGEARDAGSSVPRQAPGRLAWAIRTQPCIQWADTQHILPHLRARPRRAAAGRAAGRSGRRAPPGPTLRCGGPAASAPPCVERA